MKRANGLPAWIVNDELELSKNVRKIVIIISGKGRTMATALKVMKVKEK
jgi:hypothetical protein